MGTAMAVHSPEDDEPPLNPAAERMRRKLARLLLLSGGIMVLGLIAVFSAIVYKLSQSAAEIAEAAQGPAVPPVESRIVIPKGARLVATALDGAQALLHIEGADGSASLLLVDLASGDVVGRYALHSD